MTRPCPEDRAETLRMSDGISYPLLRRSLASRWQVPLLGLSIIMLGAAFLRFRPVVQPPPVQQLCDQAIALHKGGFQAAASEQIVKLLRDPSLTVKQRGTLNRTLAETIFQAEQAYRVHDPENARRIVLNHRRALEAGLPATADVHEQMAQAFEWLGDLQAAIEQYHKAIAAGSERSGRLRRSIIELLKRQHKASPELVSEELARLLAEPRPEPNDLLWAVEQQIESLFNRDQLPAARDLLDAMAPRLRQAGQEPHTKYLSARLNYLAGEYDQAERGLLDLRNELGAQDPLSAKAGWLLGRLHYRDGRPQEALACFREVLQTQPDGPYNLPCQLGVAESLAALQHMDEAAKVYEDVIGLAAARPENEFFDRDTIRTSLTSLYATLRAEGCLEEALRFLKPAVALVPPENKEMIAAYTRRLAELYASLGDQLHSRISPPPGAPAPSTRRAQSPETLAAVRDAFLKGAEEYLRLSHLLVLDDKGSAEAAWEAAIYFDRANEPDRLIAVLEKFLTDHPQSPLRPEALYRLGQAFQSTIRYGQAIARYAEVQERFPRTPAGMRSSVPMAQCYMAMGPSYYGQAERTLLGVIEQPAEMGRYAPEALEYREALFLSGELYDRWDKPLRAITRLEEFLERYPQDPRTAEVQFMLACAYCRSRLVATDTRPASTNPAGEGGSVPSGADRLARAEGLFAEVIRSLEQRRAGGLTALDQLRLKFSYVYRADCAFDLQEYERALTLYEETTRKFRTEPVALQAGIQVLSCCQRLGKDDQARLTLQRIKYMLKDIPAERFKELPDAEDLAYWQGLLEWIEKSNLF